MHNGRGAATSCAGAVLAGCLLWLAPLCHAVDKSGVSANAISLPQGPGSIEGLGESFQPSLSSGTGRQSLSLVMPRGTAGHTPELVLAYDGGGSNGPVGFGWDLGAPFIQRQTDYGIPRYVDGPNGVDDDADGTTDETDEVDVYINDLREALIPQADGFYFCENEDAFIRYRRVEEHWEGNLPDGSLMEFGLTDGARLTDSDTGRVFCWMLEKLTDTNGNAIRYSYTSFPGDESLNQRYLAKVEYGPGGPPWTSFHFASFEYETRPDWFEDCRPGFTVRTGMRLKTVFIGTQGPTLDGHASGDFNDDGITDSLNRKYRLAYEAHGHWSLLTSVTLVGADNETSQPPMVLEYTVCDPPEIVSAGSSIIGSANTPAYVMDNDLVDLADLNGDGLPDLLKTDQFGGAHTAYLNEGEEENGAETVIRWASGVTIGGDPLAQNVNLASASGAVAHLADMDADGLADLVYKADTEVYYFLNTGTVCWGPRARMNVDPSDSAPPSPFGVEDVSTADLDFDKRMDVIQSVRTGVGVDYRIWLNLGDQRFSKSVTVSQEHGFMLSDPAVHLADFNGDRVPDVVRIRPTSLEVTAGLGCGRFTALKTVPFPDYTLSDVQIGNARLEDVTGDGLPDLVIERAQPGQLWYWVNLGCYVLEERRIVSGIPALVGTDPAIRWADLNGNGTTDLVYADRYSQPTIQTVDIGALIGCVPAPNLLVKVDNGIGQKTTVEYDTSTRFALNDAAAGNPWPDPLPFPVDVVSKTTVDDSMGNLYTTEYRYHDGYYDGRKHQFRGFARAEQIEAGDSTAPTLVSRSYFDTGRDVVAMKGKLLRQTAEQEDGAVFWDEATEWTHRTLRTGTDGRSVTYAHPISRTRDVIEKGAGAPVQIQWDYEYDDYGNMTRRVEYGRVDAGWDDERVTETVYSAGGPSGLSAWILHAVIEQTTTDEDGNLAAHQRNYYDGNTALFELSRGNLTRVEDWVREGKYVASVRNEYDDYGNLLAAYDPLYDTQPGHYREFVFDKGLHTYPVEEVIHTGNSALPTLTVSAAYDVGWGVVVSSTNYSGFTTYYEYDVLARLTAITRPPDTAHTVEYDYALAQPLESGRTINWVETRRRESDAGGTVDSRVFTDGLGRTIMTRAEGEDPGQVVVTGTVQFNARRMPQKNYLPYFEEGGTLDFAEPASGAAFTESFHDATGRVIQMNQPAGLDGVAYATTTYAPLARTVCDEEQTNPASAHHGCGTRYVEDGLVDDSGSGRVCEVYEIVKLGNDGETVSDPVEWFTTYSYDVLGNMTGYTDSQENQKSNEFDGLSRRTFTDDPDSGRTTYEYDDAGNLVRTADAKGQVVEYTYDGVNRMTAEYYGGLKTVPDVEYHYDLPYGPVSRGELWEPSPDEEIVDVLLGDDSDADEAHDVNNDGQVDVADAVAAARSAACHRKQAGGVVAENTLGILSWVRDQSGEEHNSYDARGRTKWVVKRIVDTGPDDLRSFCTAMEYDSMDRVTKVTYADRTAATYAYNSRGLLESVPNVISRLDYNPAGKNTSLELACGTVTAYSYDHRLRLKGLRTIRLRDGLPIQDLDYSYDGVSNVTGIADGRTDGVLDEIGEELDIGPEQARRFRATQSFLHDSLYRLTEAVNPAAFGTINYRYDRVGNMVSKNAQLIDPDPLTDLGEMRYGGSAGSWGRAGRGPADPPGPHAFTSSAPGEAEEGVAVTYDANGNVTSQRGMTLTWDHADRLTEVTTEGKHAKYSYDYANQRRKKQTTEGLTTSSVFYVDDFSELRDGRFLKYIYAGSDRIARADSSDGSGVIPSSFYLHDHVGSTNQALSQDGAVTEQTTYYPFGGVQMTQSLAELALASHYTFAGKERDSETGLHYFGARYHAAFAGRFISVDDAVMAFSSSRPGGGINGFDPQNLNPYTYGRNNPITIKDTGESPAAIGALVGAGIGAGVGAVAGAAKGLITGLWKKYVKGEKISLWKHVGRSTLEGMASGAVAGAVAGAISGAVVGAAATGGLSLAADIGVAIGAGAAGGFSSSMLISAPLQVRENLKTGKKWYKGLFKTVAGGTVAGAVGGFAGAGIAQIPAMKEMGEAFAPGSRNAAAITVGETLGEELAGQFVVDPAMELGAKGISRLFGRRESRAQRVSQQRRESIVPQLEREESFGGWEGPAPALLSEFLSAGAAD